MHFFLFQVWTYTKTITFFFLNDESLFMKWGGPFGTRKHKKISETNYVKGFQIMRSIINNNYQVLYELNNKL